MTTINDVAIQYNNIIESKDKIVKNMSDLYTTTREISEKIENAVEQVNKTRTDASDKLNEFCNKSEQATTFIIKKTEKIVSTYEKIASAFESFSALWN